MEVRTIHKGQKFTVRSGKILAHTTLIQVRDGMWRGCGAFERNHWRCYTIARGEGLNGRTTAIHLSVWGRSQRLSTHATTFLPFPASCTSDPDFKNSVSRLPDMFELWIVRVAGGDGKKVESPQVVARMLDAGPRSKAEA